MTISLTRIIKFNDYTHNKSRKQKEDKLLNHEHDEDEWEWYGP